MTINQLDCASHLETLKCSYNVPETYAGPKTVIITGA